MVFGAKDSASLKPSRNLNSNLRETYQHRKHNTFLFLNRTHMREKFVPYYFFLEGYGFSCSDTASQVLPVFQEVLFSSLSDKK